MLKFGFSACKRLILLYAAVHIATLIPFGPELIQGSYAADNYTAAEKVYLKNITPSLYEFSQIAALVSESVLTLQSSPAEECAGQFAYYEGLISSFKKQLSALSAPPRMESVHRNSLESLAEYETALRLYGEACVEEDYGTKESLVSRGGGYINNSVGRIGKVYSEIDSLKTMRTQVESDEDEALAEGGVDFEDTRDIVAGSGVLKEDETAGDIKTREEVMGGIPRQVEAGKPTPDAATKESPVSERTVSEVAAPEYQAAKTAAPEAAVPQIESPETGAREVAPPVAEFPEHDADVAAETKIESEDFGQKQDTMSGEKEDIAEQEKTNDQTARIEKINQAIMSRETEGQKIPEEEIEEKITESEVSSHDVNTADTPEIASAEPGTFERVESGATVPPDEIKSWCMSKMYSEEEIANCIRSRAEAKENVELMVKAFPDGTEGRKILEKCKSDWKEGDTYNYDLVLSCAQFFCARKGLDRCEQMAR